MNTVALPHPVMPDSLRSVQDNFDALALYLNSAASASVGDWQTISPASGWAPYSSSYLCRFRKDGNGIVYVEGLLKATATFNDPTTLFTLPAGYRPPSYRTFLVPGNDSNGSASRGIFILVQPVGLVQLQTAIGGSWSGQAGSYTYLDGVIFAAA